MFIIEGNIGAGKSTLLEQIEENIPQVRVLREPQENWSTHISGESLLENFYTNPSRWGYTLETYTLMRRANDLAALQRDLTLQNKTSTQTNPSIVSERSIFSGHYCFAQNSYKQGYLTALEWHMYNAWAEFLFASCPMPSGFIYLRSTPEHCFERVAKRARAGEEGIPLSYLQDIHVQHERFLIQKTSITPALKDIPVLVLDGTPEFASDPILLADYLAAIRVFIERHYSKHL